ncbi:MAG: hypothetical protein AB1689_15605 [Thermodesulfobacteriota bacterium]
MPIWCCTECGCEAVASNVDMVISMGWLVEPAGSDDEAIAALCAKCRVYRKGPARAPSLTKGMKRLRQASHDATEVRADAARPRGRPRS